jgi:transposase
LTDVEWGVISAFLPPKPRRASSDDRSLINGILYVITTGCRWREMPRKYESYVTAWRRLQEAGVWDKIMDFLSSMGDCRSVAVDSTTIKAGVRG